MVKILADIYTVKIYQRPLCIVKDILHLEIVMGTVDTSLKKKTFEKSKKLASCLRK